jgi:hypothetical protein
LVEGAAGERQERHASLHHDNLGHTLLGETQHRSALIDRNHLPPYMRGPHSGAAADLQHPSTRHRFQDLANLQRLPVEVRVDVGITAIASDVIDGGAVLVIALPDQIPPHADVFASALTYAAHCVTQPLTPGHSDCKRRGTLTQGVQTTLTSCPTSPPHPQGWVRSCCERGGHGCQQAGWQAGPCPVPVRERVVIGVGVGETERLEGVQGRAVTFRKAGEDRACRAHAELDEEHLAQARSDVGPSAPPVACYVAQRVGERWRRHR